MSCRIGIIGFGALGQYLAEKIVSDNIGSIEFICNRSRIDGVTELPVTLLSDLDPNGLKNLILEKNVDIVIEVAHPVISETYGESILELCDYMVGSPTSFASEGLLERLLNVATVSGRRLLIPVGALWGAEDIRRMADRGTLKGLTVSMTKHPSCFRLEDSNIMTLNETAIQSGKCTVLFEGPVAKLCKIAPNNVNTMAVAAIAAHNLGFGNCVGKLVSDPDLRDFHKIDIEVIGPQNTTSGGVFSVRTERTNPAPLGGVTGQQTYVSFLSSLKAAVTFPGPPGLRIC